MIDIRIDYSKVSEKFFVKHEDIREKFKIDVVKVITGKHIEQVNFKKLKGKLKGYSLIAVDAYRIIYKIFNGQIIIVSVNLVI